MIRDLAMGAMFNAGAAFSVQVWPGVPLADWKLWIAASIVLGMVSLLLRHATAAVGSEEK